MQLLVNNVTGKVRYAPPPGTVPGTDEELVDIPFADFPPRPHIWSGGQLVSHPRTLLRLAETANGITVGGIRLAASERDRSLFAQGLVLLREAEDMLPDEEAKAAFRASHQTIADADGVTHTMSVTDLRSLLVAYGSAYQALWTAAASTP